MKRGCLGLRALSIMEYDQWPMARQLVSELQANFYTIYDYYEWSLAQTLANSIIVLNTQKRNYDSLFLIFLIIIININFGKTS